jgi:hypothetical protein
MNISLNINKDDSEMNDFIYCYNNFGSIPNKILIHGTFLYKPFNDELLDYEVVNTFTEIITEEQPIINERIILKINNNIIISYIVIDRDQEHSVTSELTAFFKDDNDRDIIDEVLDRLRRHIISYEEEDFKLNVITYSNTSGLDIEPIINKLTKESFDYYYSHKTKKSINRLVKRLKDNNRGLGIMWGERGTGKTSAISYISSKLDRTFIYIPNNMIEHTIGNPELGNFLKRFNHPVLLVDDCEMIFSDMFSRSNIITSSLLQLVDGVLSDVNNISILMIFNTDNIDDIDYSLLDCNNIIDDVEFEFLNKDESNKLSSYLCNKEVYKNKNKVIDIIRKKKTHNKKIGF